MRKNDLIALLENIKGNPEIVMWNGYVDEDGYLLTFSTGATSTTIDSVMEETGSEARTVYWMNCTKTKPE